MSEETERFTDAERRTLAARAERRWLTSKLHTAGYGGYAADLDAIGLGQPGLDIDVAFEVAGELDLHAEASRLSEAHRDEIADLARRIRDWASRTEAP